MKVPEFLIFMVIAMSIGFTAGGLLIETPMDSVCDYLGGAVEGNVCIKDGEVIYEGEK